MNKIALQLEKWTKAHYMERCRDASAVLDSMEVHLHVTILGDEYQKKITTCIYGIKKWIPSLLWVEKKSTWLLFCCLPSRWSRNVTRPCNLWRTNYPIISNTIVLYNQIEIQWAMFVWWIYYKVAVVPWTSSTRSSNLYSNQRQNLHQNPLILTNLLEVKSNLIKQSAGTLCRTKHILIQYHG